MKICIDISQAQYLGTGVGHYTHQLVHHLVELKSSHHFHLFGFSLRNKSLLYSLFSPLVSKRVNLSLYSFPSTAVEWLANNWHHLDLSYLLGPADIYHSSDWTQWPYHGARRLTTIHDLTPLKFPQHLHSKIVATHRRRFKWVTQETDIIIADSHATKTDCVRLLGIPSTRIHVIHLAASADFLAFVNQDRHQRLAHINRVKRQYDLPDSYLLSVGTNEPRKNLDRVIQAVHLLNQDLEKPLPLVIAGKFGWGKFTRSPHLVRTIGFVPQADLPALYTGAQLFIYASLYEGFGLPVLEAMTVGTPVITTNRGSLAEVASDAAVLVNPYSISSIASGLLQGLTQKTILRQAGLKHVKKFSWSNTARFTLELYENLYNKKN